MDICLWQHSTGWARGENQGQPGDTDDPKPSVTSTRASTRKVAKNNALGYYMTLAWKSRINVWGDFCFSSPPLYTVVLRKYALSCVWLFVTPMDCSPPYSSVHGISQARILEWVALSSSRAFSWPRDWALVSPEAPAGRFFTTEPHGKPILLGLYSKISMILLLFSCYIWRSIKKLCFMPNYIKVKSLLFIAELHYI